ncbi:bifunctional phosphoribosyl-AMP cyclohydrolase/phosphoribosyl-ATP pyrophosphatase [Helicobacter sp. 11S02596-1]|nr:bifunctional phosphoribosyl-AMP cyclohydrolase/phosphoribosyl-ATP pyrophosphatase [Helicobacter sp. 11S02596-1]
MIERLDWVKSPLIPAIVQQYDDNRVLMLGFMDQEALKLTLETGLVHYFSRTRNRIWKKGETSNHTQKLIEMFLDCDNDTLLLKVDQTGNVCHTGATSCFFRQINLKDGSLCDGDQKHALGCENNTKDRGAKNNDENNLQNTAKTSVEKSILDALYKTLQQRKTQSPETSYTASLYAKGENGICKKIIEEAGELTFAIKDGQKDQIVYECSDLIYHILVGLSDKNIHPNAIKHELTRRFGLSGIEEKNSRK